MSVVVAIKENDKVYLGGDSFIGSGWTHRTLTNKHNQKIFKAYDNKDIMIGFVGRFREANIISTTEKWINKLTILENKVNFKTIARDVVKKIFKELKDNGRYIQVDKEDWTWDSEILFIYKNDVYQISSDGCVQVIDDYIAIGAGKELALGYLHQSEGEDPKERIVKAIDIQQLKQVILY